MSRSSLTVSRPRFLRASQVFSIVYLFYDGPNPPSGIFESFLGLENQNQNIDTRSYADLIKTQAYPVLAPAGR